MTTRDQILLLKPTSIFDVMPEDVFKERNHQEHSAYIRSGNCYEIKWAVAKFLQPKTILEIGVRYGYSLATFMAACGPSYVEGWDNGSYKPNWEDVAAKALARFGQNFWLRRGDCQDMRTNEVFDLVHIDGPHYYDWTMHCLEEVKLSGAILVDDYFNCPDDRRAVDDFATKYAHNVKEKIVFDSIRGDCLLLMR